MKIVGEGREVDTIIAFRVWRKFAAHYHIPYESWEEGKVVLLKKFDKKLLRQLR
ncbi:U exon [Baboon adenovirus 3]|uniref:U exon n=1 Tax=Simian mastadenovirus C TaxID=1962300 RepID=M9YVF0_9ADEN|nr:U exon [Baboon adenovirus 3]AGK27151.1 U exon [Baboon adenovirus 3]AGK27223.1 U exon [Simian mastadenovirus C]